MKRYLLVLIYLIISSCLNGSTPADSLLTEGKLLFKNNCKSCHNLEKKLVGPALAKVYERRDSSWIYRFINESQKMISEGDPVALELYSQFNEVIMPDQNLDNQQISLILGYIKNEDETGSASSDNPISRPIMPVEPYSDHFRFSNYIFWIPFTISIILGVFVLNFLTYYYEIEQEFLEKRDKRL